ncbi:hypothetical protein GPECTOR_14g99 [Gonium pectorale]|uniref:Peptidase A2 domain-containing protein n=1 Tax=Gonium pectorale TaxID=33097 RepID=A0A150GMW8_GONPE|nr:hypothetical protein GPECTOR_14g99 [Gonium pectorale]|eukprot:KXZ51118.1 hypothetical protein GPECTOR_14g99 [Gonium pectorale]
MGLRDLCPRPPPAVVSGRGKHLGIAVSWSLRWTSSGAFVEEIRGPQLTFKWGYDGRPDSGCWEVDSSGLVRVMECDDHELRVRVLVRRRDWRLLGFDHRLCADTETWELGEWRQWDSGVLYPSSALHKAANGGQHAYLTAAGAAERRQRPAAELPPASRPSAAPAIPSISSPSPYSSDLPQQHPHRHQHREHQPGQQHGHGQGPPQSGVPAPLPPPTWFGLPDLPAIPPDTTYGFLAPLDPASDPGPASSAPGAGGSGGQPVPLWRAASGHYLVRPRINGQEGGYFVLDTGASGFVMTPQAAARLGGSSFGETHAASVSGKVAARFVRLGSWSLGGLELRGPVLMVMGLEGLVRGAPGEVVGIVGHDLFRRAVVELPQLIGPGAATMTTRGSSALGASGFGSDVDSESGSDDDASAPASAAAGALAAARAAPSAEGVYGGEAVAFGPPPPAPLSTPAFGPEALALEAGPSGGGARGAPIGAAVAAAPAPASARTLEGSVGSVADAAGAPTAAAPASPDRPPLHRSGSGSDCSTGSSPNSSSSTSSSAAGRSSRADGDDDVGSSSSGSSGGGSGGGSGRMGGKLARRPGGRSATARAMRRAARNVPYSLHELILHHPLHYGNEAGWDWEPLIMIANLPHVRLRFADPTGAVRSALLMVDSGACGADVMIHDRANRELRLAEAAAAAAAEGGASGSGSVKGSGGGGGTAGHYLRGVGQEPRDYVQLQVLELPWLEVAGVRFPQVTCMCAAVGGLDISVYSHGILCGDLLARLPWAIDYTHKRMGFRPGASAAPLRQPQPQQRAGQ